MDAQSYDSWYDTPRGEWIGRRETALVLDALRPRQGESLLDVGCGTGFFTRALAASLDGPVTGVDVNPEYVKYARSRDAGRATYAVADARALPCADASFDLVVSITALCFVEDEVAALGEMLRVTRRRFAIGLLNRHSLLYLGKGRGGGSGGYRGARWHTRGQARHLFEGLSVRRLGVSTAIQLPGGGRLARLVENAWPSSIPGGAFLLVSGDVVNPA